MIVGTAGHIDHGKTALVKALTGTDADRLKEEKARGITIDLGFAYARLGQGDRITGFVDVPGHERFIHTMLAGAGGIDFALLVVAADDGVMPQTREHLAILDLLGVSRGTVALTKADLADETRRAAVSAEIAALLEGTRLQGTPVLPVSTVTGEGIDVLRAALAAAETETRRSASAGRFRLAVDRSFTLAGAGTVVTGTVLSGSVSVGDQVLVSPSGIAARVRSIHAQNSPAERGEAGERCALNLAGDAVSKDAIGRGDMVVDPFLHAPALRIDAQIRVLGSEAKPVGPWFSARLHHGSAERGVRIVPLGPPLQPGGEGLAQLVLDRPIAASAGDRFILRDVSAQRTIGGGRFLDLRAPERRRRTPERLALLGALAAPAAKARLREILGHAPFAIDLTGFERDGALGAEEMAGLLCDLGVVVLETGPTRFGLSASQWRRFCDSLVTETTRFHAENPELQGIGRERLRLAATPRLPPSAFRAAIARAAGSGAIVLEGAFVRLPEHEVRLEPADEALFGEIAPHLAGEARFRPPRVRDLANLLGTREAEIRRVLKLCARLGRVDQIAHDHFFLRATTAEMVGLARQMEAQAETGWFTAASFRDTMSNGRKVAIEILDFLDRHGVTLRRGDLRRMNPHRLDLFEVRREDR